MGIMDRAPHPKAAKLCVNWLLSREGQATYQKSIALPSLRVDIPKTGFYPFDVPKAGVSYAVGGAEEYSRLSRDAIRDLINDAVNQRRK